LFLLLCPDRRRVVVLISERRTFFLRIKPSMSILTELDLANCLKIETSFAIERKEGERNQAMNEKIESC